MRFNNALLALVLLLAGCSGGLSANPTRDTSAQAFADCNHVMCSGTLDGGDHYQIKLPKIWNGTLLLYSHGYRSPDPLPPDYGPVPTNVEVAPGDAVADALLSSGYALAGATQPLNGWTVRDSLDAADRLYALFRDKVGRPTRVYTWGESIGGLVSELLAEQREWVSGTAPMCGVLAGTNLNQDLALDVAFGVKVLLDPGERLTGFANSDAARATYDEAAQKVEAAAQAGGLPLAKVLLVGALVNAPEQSSAEDGSTPASRVKAVVQNVLGALAVGIIGRPDLERRMGGNPSTNVESDYDARAPDLKLAEIAQLTGTSVAANRELRSQLDAAPRVKPDTAARLAADELGTPSGELRVPTITLHTTVDPLAVPQNERVFADSVAKASARTADLLQLFTQPPAHFTGTAPYGAGDCAFTTWEQVGTIISLDRWVKTGDQPTLQELATMLAGPDRKTGFIPAYQPVPWPALKQG